MRSRSRIVAALIGIALSILLGIWITRSREPRDIAIGPKQPDPPRPAEIALTEIPQDKAAVRSEAPAPSETESASASVWISGRCIDEFGRAISGAQVSLLEFTPLPQEGRGKALHVADAPDDPVFHPTQTDNDGRFVFEHQLGSSWRALVFTLEARAQGTALTRLRNGVQAGALMDVGDVVLIRGTSVGGFVRDVAGVPCPGIQIYARFKNNNVNECRSGADGSFHIDPVPAAPMRIAARASDEREADLDLDLSDGVPRLDLELILPLVDGPDSISGIVVDPDGNPVPRAQLHIEPEPDSTKQLRLMTQTREDGRFRLEEVEGAVLSILARDYQGQRFGAFKATGVRGGTHGLELRLTSEGGFTLRVVDEGGQPIERFGYIVFIETQHLAPAAVGDHPGGEAKLIADPLPFGLRVHAPCFASQDIEPLVAGQIPPTLVVTLARATCVRGEVRAQGKPVSGARVVLSREDYTYKPARRAHSLDEPTAKTDAEGCFELTVERAGTIVLRAATRVGNTLLSDPIQIQPGVDVDGIVLVVVESGGIQGTVLRHDGSPAENLSVKVLDSTGSTIVATGTDAKGSFAAKDLAPGNYQLQPRREFGMRLGKPAKFTPSEPLDEWRCEVQSGQTSEVQIRLREPVFAHARLELPSIAGSSWSIAWELTDPRTGEPIILDENHSGGVFERTHEFLDPCPLSLAVESNGKGIPMFLRKQAPLPRGLTEIVFAPGFGQVQGRLLSPLGPDERVRISWKSGDWSASAELECESNGSYFLPCVPVGTCSLSRSTRPEATRQIEVRAGELSQAEAL